MVERLTENIAKPFWIRMRQSTAVAGGEESESANQNSVSCSGSRGWNCPCPALVAHHVASPYAELPVAQAQCLQAAVPCHQPNVSPSSASNPDSSSHTPTHGGLNGLQDPCLMVPTGIQDTYGIPWTARWIVMDGRKGHGHGLDVDKDGPSQRAP